MLRFVLILLLLIFHVFGACFPDVALFFSLSPLSEWVDVKELIFPFGEDKVLSLRVSY